MLRTSILSGIFTFLGILLYGFLSSMTAGKIPILPVFVFLIFFAGIYYSHYDYKKKFKTLSYSQGLKLGFGVSFTLGFLVGIRSYFYVLYTDRDFFNKLATEVSNILHKRGYGDKIIESYINSLKTIISPFNLFILILLISVIYGVIISSIASIFTKNTQRAA